MVDRLRHLRDRARVQPRAQRRRQLLLALSGLLSAAFGVIMFSHPGAGALALLALVPAFAFVTGVMQIAFALELRRIVSELDRRLRPHPTAKPLAHA